MAASRAIAEDDAPVHLTWDKVLTWRVEQHRLGQRAGPERALDVIGAIGCLHAQLLPSAELSLWARVEGLASGDVERLLWDERVLVKTWAMRGTLHLVPTAEYPVWQGALSAYEHFLKKSWLRGFGVTRAEVEALIPAVGRVLGGRALTREELADAVAADTGISRLRDKLLDSWGALLKPPSFRGQLCFAPNAGRNVRFTAPASWIGGFDRVDSAEGLAEVTRRYLTAHGPATREDYARWVAHTPAASGRLIDGLGSAVVEVDVEGTRARMLAADARAAAAAEPTRSVRLLPAFDPWVVGAPRKVDAYCPAAHRDRVYRRQGWISPVVLVDGRIAGAWEHRVDDHRVTVTVESFTDLPVWARDAAGREAERLAAFFDRKLDLDWR